MNATIRTASSAPKRVRALAAMAALLVAGTTGISAASAETTAPLAEQASSESTAPLEAQAVVTSAPVEPEPEAEAEVEVEAVQPDVEDAEPDVSEPANEPADAPADAPSALEVSRILSGFPTDVTSTTVTATADTVAPSTPQDVTAAPAVPPSAPLDVTATQTGPASFSVTWNAPSDLGTSSVTGYRITARPMSLAAVYDISEAVAAASEEAVVHVGPSERSTVMNDLQPDARYLFTVTALSGAGDSPVDWVDATADEWVAPSAVQDVTLAQTGPGQVTLRFAAPADQGSSPVSGYVVGISGPDAAGYTEHDADTREVVVDDLAAGAYDVRVLAVNEQGLGRAADLRVVVEAGFGVPVDGPSDQPVDAPDVAPVVPVVAAAPVRPEAGTTTTAVATTAVATAVATTDNTTTDMALRSPSATALARTGQDAGTVALGGLLLVGLGGGLLVATRRRTGPVG